MEYQTKIFNVPGYFNFMHLQSIPAHKLYYTEWGDNKCGRHILCLHGLTRNSHDFDFLANELSKNYHIICLDVVGRGKSSWFKDFKHYNFHTYVKDITSLLSSLKINKLDIIGTSMGGIIAMGLAATKSALINRIVLNDVGPSIPLSTLNRIGKYIEPKTSFANFDECKEHLKKILAPFGIRDEDHWNHMVKHSFVMQDDKRYYPSYDPKLSTAFKKAPNMSKSKDLELWHIWDKIKCPVFVIKGEDSDILLNCTVEKMIETKKHIKIASFQNVGHAPALMDKEQITTILNWLQ